MREIKKSVQDRIEEDMDFLKEEFRQAWAHYRHVENERDMFLGFSFTLILGFLAFLFSQINNIDLNILTAWKISKILIFSNIIVITLEFLLIAVFKIKHILRHYENVRNQIRNLIYVSKELKNKFAINGSQNPILQAAEFRHQNIAQAIILVYVVIIITLQIILVFLSSAKFLQGSVILMIFFLLLPVFIGAYYIIRYKTMKK